MLAKLPGKVLVVGYTDGSDPPTARTPSAWHQAMEWARGAADVLRPQLGDARLAVEARVDADGAAKPLRRRRDRPVPGMKASTRFAQCAVNLGAAGALLWFAAPLLAFGGWHPFDDVRARRRLAGAGRARCCSACAGCGCCWRRRRNARLLKGLESGDAGTDAEPAFPQGAAMLRQGIEANGRRGAGGSAGARCTSCPGT